MQGPIKKSIPKYETKAWTAHVVEEEILNENNVPVKIKVLKPDHPAYVQHELKHFLVGDEVLVKTTNKKRIRTQAQNDYMHLYFSLIALSSGHTTQEIKNWAKGRFLTKGITEIFGDKVRDVQETSKLKVLEMMEFLERVETHTGIPLPDTEPFNLALTHAEWDELKEEQKTKYKALKPTLEGIDKLK